jgi:hypothetical protein
MTKAEFLSRLRSSEGCHIWSGAVGKNGYGTVKIDTKYMHTHKAAFLFTKRPVPSGLMYVIPVTIDYVLTLIIYL